MMANAKALTTPGQGLPFGPYSPQTAANDKLFPATGTGRLSNATAPTLAWPKAANPPAAKKGAAPEAAKAAPATP